MGNIATLSAQMVMNAQGFFATADRVSRRTGAMETQFAQSSKRIQGLFSPDLIFAGFIGGAASQVVSQLMAPINKAFEFLGKGIQKAMDLEQVQIQLEVMLGSAERAATLVSKLKEMNVGGVNQFDAAQRLVGFGVGEGEVLSVIKQIANISGGDPEKFNRIALQFGQIQAKGKLLAEDLNIIAESGINLREVLARQLGVSVADVAKLMEKGAITADDFKRALKELSETKFAGMMERQSGTLNGLVQRFEKAGTDAGRQFAEGFANGMGLEGGSFERFVNVLEALNKHGVIEESGAITGGLLSPGLNLEKIFGKNSPWLPSEISGAAPLARAEEESKRLTKAIEEANQRAADRAEQERRQKDVEAMTRQSSFINSLGLPNGLQQAGRFFGNAVGVFQNAVGGVGGAGLASMFRPGPDMTRTTEGLRVGTQEAFAEIIRHQFGGKRAEDAEREKMEASKKLTTATESLAKSFEKLINTGKTIGIISAFGGGK